MLRCAHGRDGPQQGRLTHPAHGHRRGTRFWDDISPGRSTSQAADGDTRRPPTSGCCFEQVDPRRRGRLHGHPARGSFRMDTGSGWASCGGWSTLPLHAHDRTSRRSGAESRTRCATWRPAEDADSWTTGGPEIRSSGASQQARWAPGVTAHSIVDVGGCGWICLDRNDGLVAYGARTSKALPRRISYARTLEPRAIPTRPRGAADAERAL